MQIEGGESGDGVIPSALAIVIKTNAALGFLIKKKYVLNKLQQVLLLMFHIFVNV